MIKTKIVCTIGPETEGYDAIYRMVESGMNVARLNFSHGSHAQHLVIVNHLKKARNALKQPLAIMLDTKGPEVRLGQIQGEKIHVDKGDCITLTSEKIKGSKHKLSVLPGSVLRCLTLEDQVLFNDGYISSKVIKASENEATVEVENPGVLCSGKGVNIPGVSLDLPTLTDRDIADIRFACANDMDMIAASFVRTSDNVITLKKLLKDYGKGDILVVSKIECQEAIENFDSILQVSDGIMIARGDLGVELPLSQVPKLQKMMIRKCYLAGKPAITATQMLESMIDSPRPTRAEVSDVANAIYDSTSAVMLSGETAVGAYPLETIQVMKKIIRVAENDRNYRDFFYHESKKIYSDVPAAVAFSSVNTAYSANAKAIFVFTSTGYTPRLVSRLRAEIPVLALTSKKMVFHQLSLNWGVTPLYDSSFSTLSEAFKLCADYALKNGILTLGDIVVLTAGSPFGVSGTTNMMIVENIGDVLVRGFRGVGAATSGRVTLLFSPDSDKLFSIKDRIIVISRCDDSYLPLLKEAKGIVLENQTGDIESEKYVLLVAKTLNIPAIVRSEGACCILKEGQLVTLDPKSSIVYNGIQELL